MALHIAALVGPVYVEGQHPVFPQQGQGALYGRMPVLRADGAQLVQQLLDAVVHHAVQVGEVVIKGLTGDAAFFHQLGDGDVVQPLGLEQQGQGVQDLIFGRFWHIASSFLDF